MKHHLMMPLVILYFVASMLGCVSVDLKPKAATKSSTYKAMELKKPFQKMDSEQADVAWQNQKTGNTIAVLTECSESRDPLLTTLESETVSALNNPHTLKTQETTFAERGALRTLVEGQVDGIQVQMDILTFKKNSCSYTLSYIGRSKSFDSDRPTFEQFLKGFEVP